MRKTLDLLDDELRMLAVKLVEARNLGDPSVMTRMQEELSAATLGKSAAEEAQRAAEMAQGEVARLKPTLQLVEKKHQDLLEVDGRITKSRTRISELAEQLTKRQAVHDERLRLAQARQKELTEAADKRLLAEKEYDKIARLSLAVADAKRLTDLRGRLKRARTLREQIASKDALSRQGMSAPKLRKLEELMAEVADKTVRLEAKAPQVTVQLGPKAGDRVRFQGNIIDAPIKSPVLGPTRIEIDTIATVEVIPVSVPTDMQALSEARANLDKGLMKEGVASVTEARKRRAATEDVDAERRGLAAELSIIAPDKDGEDGVTVLERELVDAEANATGVTAGRPLPSPEELKVRRQKAEATRDEMRLQHRDREIALRAAQSDLGVEERHLASTRQELATAEANLRNDLETRPDDWRGGEIARLNAAVAQTRGEFTAAEENANSLRASVPSEEQRALIAARIQAIRRCHRRSSKDFTSNCARHR